MSLIPARWTRLGPDRLALALALAHALLALYYSLVIPLGEAPDEVPHYHYARFIAAHAALPVGDEGGNEGIQPPLYYALGALLTAPIPEGAFRVQNNPDFSLTRPETQRNALLHPPTEDPPYRDGALAWHLLRLLSVAMGAATVYGIYRIGRLVVPAEPAVALGAAAFAAFLPGFVGMSAVANNDNAVILLTTWALYTLVRLTRPGAAPAGYAAAGLLLGLAFLAKTSGLALLGLLPIVTFQRLRRGGRPAPELAAAAGALLLALLLSGWWFARNQALYGDPLAWGYKLATSDTAADTPLGENLWGTARGLYVSFWGKFGGVIHLPLPQWLYALLGAALALALLGNLRRFTRPPKARLAVDGASAAVLGLHAALLVLAFVRWMSALLGAGQARLLFPALAGFSLLVSAGLWQGLPQAVRRPTLAALGAGFAALAVAVPPLFVLPAFAGPPVFAAVPPALAAPGPWAFGPSIALAGLALPEAPVAPGSAAAFDLAWRALRAPDGDYRLRLEARGPDGAAVAAKEGTPTAGRDTTDRWRAGEVRLARHYLDLPANAPAGRYTLVAAVYPVGAPAAPLATTPLGTFRVGQNPPEPAPLLPFAADVGPVWLVGVRLGAARPGTALPVDLAWRAVSPVPGPPYTVFVHLSDAAGRLLAQDDAPPARGAYPTTVWAPGERVFDPHSVPLPPDLSPGRYSLTVGLYDPATGARLRGSAGDAITIGEITIP